MVIVQETGPSDLATVYVAELKDGSRIEFAESAQPPLPRSQKWILIVSTLKGCPVGCPICDAGGDYRGKLTAEEILGQIEYLVRLRYPDGRVPVPRLKIQFARMGDPALNEAVLDVLQTLPSRLELPGLMPSISTVAPAGCDRFFDRLLAIKDDRFPGGRFQMQFSIHTTDMIARRKLVPVRTWSFEQMAAFGERFFAPGDRKVSLNFAPARGYPLEPEALAPVFSPEKFLIKLTPINPTHAAGGSGLVGVIDPSDPEKTQAVVRAFRAQGYETILSIGELAENEIGSNCGMCVARLTAKG